MPYATYGQNKLIIHRYICVASEMYTGVILFLLMSKNYIPHLINVPSYYDTHYLHQLPQKIYGHIHYWMIFNVYNPYCMRKTLIPKYSYSGLPNCPHRGGKRMTFLGEFLVPPLNECIPFDF